MTQRQIKFLRALLNLAIEMHGVVEIEGWLGDEEFENWTKAETIELDKLLEEVGR